MITKKVSGAPGAVTPGLTVAAKDDSRDRQETVRGPFLLRLGFFSELRWYAGGRTRTRMLMQLWNGRRTKGMSRTFARHACLCLRAVGPSLWSPQAPSNLFFSYNTNLGPPYHVLMDTNFINFSIQNKLEVLPPLLCHLLCTLSCLCVDRLFRP
jgi:hypothetical protein